MPKKPVLKDIVTLDYSSMENVGVMLRQRTGLIATGKHVLLAALALISRNVTTKMARNVLGVQTKTTSTRLCRKVKEKYVSIQCHKIEAELLICIFNNYSTSAR